MTTLGDRQVFAVELAILPRRPGGLRECHFTYWIGGRAVGNFELDAPVAEMGEALRHILVDRGHRRNDRLFDRPGPEIVGIMRRWRGGDRDLERRANDERWSAHDIGYPMDHGYPAGTGARWSVYLIEGAEDARLIFVESGAPDAIHEQRMPAGHVDRILADAWDALTAID